VSNTTSREARASDETPHITGNQTGGKLRSFKDYYLGTVLRPRETFDALVSDERRVQFGIIAIAVSVQLYVLLYIFLSLGDNAFSSLRPWLSIPAASFHHYNDFFLAPSMFICWILAAGVAQLSSRAWSGKGTFEDMLSVLGFAISIGCLPALLIDLPESALGAAGIIDFEKVEAALSSRTVWHEIVMVLYFLSITWSAVLFCVGVRSVQRIRRVPAMLAGLFAYVIYQIVLIMFNK
jgi:hypothetical protein